MIAVKNKKFRAVKKLLAAGVDINLRDHQGKTAMDHLNDCKPHANFFNSELKMILELKEIFKQCETANKTSDSRNLPVK